MKLKCSIIIPHYNQVDDLTLCLHRLSSQTIPREHYEIIVVDNGSSQIIPAKIKDLVDQWLVVIEPKNPYTCRNVGVEASRSEVILFTDSKCTPSKNWIRTYLDQFNDDEIMVQTGPIEASDTTSLASLFYNVSLLNVKQLIDTKKGVLGGNLAVRLEVFRQIGVFPAIHRSAGDILWGQRVFENHIAIYYNENAKVGIKPKNNAELKSSHLRFGTGAAVQYNDIGKPWYFHLKMIIYHLLPDSPKRIVNRFRQKNLPVQHLSKIWWLTWWMNLHFAKGYVAALITRKADR